MNKYEFKMMLKNLIQTDGISFIKSKPDAVISFIKSKPDAVISFIKNDPNLRKQWNDIIYLDDDWQHDKKSNEQAQYDAAMKLLDDDKALALQMLDDDEALVSQMFDVDGAFANIDSRDFKSYMNSIYNGNEPQTLLWDFYKNNRDFEDMRNDFANASDIGPQEMAGQTKNPNFYNLGHKDGWAGTEIVKNADGTINNDRGFQYILDNYGVTREEFMKMLADETTKYSREKIWNLDDPENWKDDTYLGMDLSGDGWFDKLARWAIKKSADTYWQNTQEDYRSGKALEDPDYGVGGLNGFEVGYNVADALTSVLGGVPGVVSDIAAPLVREAYNSYNNGTDYDVFGAATEAGMRLGGRGLGNLPFLRSLSMATKDKLPTMSTKLSKLDDAIYGQQRVNEQWSKFNKDMTDEVASQIDKQWHPDLFGDADNIIIRKPKSPGQTQRRRPGEGSVVKNDKSFQSNNRDDFANPEHFKVTNEKNGNKYVYNIFNKDLEDMNRLISMKQIAPWTRGGLTTKQIARIDELSSKYPQFKETYSYKPVQLNGPAKAGADIVRFAGKAKDIGNNGIVRTLALRDLETIDIDNLKYNIDDMAKIEELYATIPNNKKELVKQGDYSTLNEREKQIVKKYNELKALDNYRVDFY